MPKPLDFRTVFDASPNAYMLLDRELCYVDANRAYLEITGSRLPDLVGRNIFDLFPHDPADPHNVSASLVRGSFERVLKTRARDIVAFLPYRVALEPGGEPVERLWSCANQTILDEQGEVAFILQHTVDVTALAREHVAESGAGNLEARTFLEAGVLHRAEIAAESNRALGDQIAGLRNLFDQAPGFVCFLRAPNHVFEMANHACNALIGHRSLIGLPIREALPDLSGQGYFELLDDALRTGKPFVGHGMRVQLDRGEHRLEEVILDFVYQPIRAASGEVVGIFVSGQDVTENRRHEARQRFLTRASESLSIAASDFEEALRRLAKTAVPDFADWVFVDLLHERQFRRMLALGPDEQAAPLAEVAREYPPDAGSGSEFARSIVAGEVRVVEVNDVERRRGARDERHHELMQRIDVRSLCLVPLHSEGRAIGAITFGLAHAHRRYGNDDIAVAKELARMVAIAQDNARLVRERDELLRREQAARERAEAANQAKDEFLAMLGHELRNPLAPILTAVQLMKLRGGRETQREETIIERQAQHLVRLVDDLLDVSRIARGKVQLRAARTDVASAIAKAVEIASPLLEQHQHDLHIDVADEALQIFGDEARLSQIVANLLTNAARYTPMHGRVRLSALAEGDQVVIRVVDNGIGIDAALLPRIFDLFTQGPQHSDRREGGLGLGLTLVRNLVTMHGGTVEAHSAGRDRGSTFEIHLPRLMAADRRSEEAVVAVSQQPLRRGRILVVDDNADAAELLANMLESRGYETAIAYDGPSALAEAERVQPSVAILDIGLPVMDGYELAEQLRERCGVSAPQLIALTGYGLAHDRKRSHAAGFLAHLVKPVDSELLFRTVESAEANTES